MRPLIKNEMWNLKRHVTWLDSVDLHAIPVEIIGLEHEGMWRFDCLAVAQQRFPELDPYHSTCHFTCAMRGELNNTPALRFETWEAYEFFSS